MFQEYSKLRLRNHRLCVRNRQGQELGYLSFQNDRLYYVVVPLFEQKALARMISGGGFERHLSRLKNYYRVVREVLLKKLSSLKYEHIIQDSGGGLHFTVKFPAAQTDRQIKEMAAGADIRVRTLSDYLILPAAGFEKTVVVNYSGVTLAKAEALDLSVI